MRYRLFLFISLISLQPILAQNFTTSNLPLILINTMGTNIPDEPKITAWMSVLNNPNGINSLSDKNYEYDGYIAIERRGNTSQMYDKKSFSVETITAEGENRNVSLLGLPKENDWVLYGPYSDKTMIRDVLAYKLGNAQGRWSPRTRFCEVFINNEYRGVYVLIEKIKIDKNRVNIASLKATDVNGDELTGGYIMRIDRFEAAKGSWWSPFLGRTQTSRVPITYFDPGFEDLAKEQKEYIKEHITQFETALAGKNFKDHQLGYRAYIDVVSFIDYLIMTELSRNLDGYRCSVYFHKDKDSKGGKLNASPFWDYNLCFGNADFMQAYNPVGWAVDGIGKGDGYEPVFWWARLQEDPYFNTLLKHRWFELRDKSFSKNNINAIIDSCATVLSEAQVRNFQKFKILNRDIWPNYKPLGSFQNEVDYLKEWISLRIDWLDSQFESIIPLFEAGVDDEWGKIALVPSVYPNPFSDQLCFRFSLEGSHKVEVLVRNPLGELVYIHSSVYPEGTSKLQIAASTLPPGNFFLYSLNVDGKRVQSGKLVRRR